MRIEELQEQLTVLIQQLPKPLWQEVWLKRLEGKDLKEICIEMGLARVKIKNIYKDGLNYLQTIAERQKIRIALMDR